MSKCPVSAANTPLSYDSPLATATTTTSMYGMPTPISSDKSNTDGNYTSPFPSSDNSTSSANGTASSGGQPKPSWLTTMPQGLNLILKNSCSNTVWPGLSGKLGGAEFFGLAGSSNPAGFELASGAYKVIPMKVGLEAGRVWARTGCTKSGSKFVCDVGDCGSETNKYDGTCVGSGGVGANSLAEFTVQKDGTVWYDLSLVDGYTMPIKMTLVGKTIDVPGAGKKYSCGNPTCAPKTDFSQCPPELLKTKNGKAVGCNSINNAINDKDSLANPNYGPILSKYAKDPTMKSHIECSCGTGSCKGESEAEVLGNLKTGGNTAGVDKSGFCCSPANKLYSGRAKDFVCKDGDKPKPLNGFGGGKSYSEVFKAICPNAYSWQFDDLSSTYQCKGEVSYIVEFC